MEVHSSTIELTTTTKLLKFVLLLEQWPCRMEWLLQFFGNVEQNSVLKLAPDQLKIFQDNDLKSTVRNDNSMTLITLEDCFVRGLIY